MTEKLTLAQAFNLITDYIRDNPDRTYTEVAVTFGYSTANIHRMAKLAGLPARRRGPRFSKVDASFAGSLAGPLAVDNN